MVTDDVTRMANNRKCYYFKQQLLTMSSCQLAIVTSLSLQHT